MVTEHPNQVLKKKTHSRTPSLGAKIQDGCNICLGSLQLSCVRGLIILGCNFQTIWATAHKVDQTVNKVLKFAIFPNIMELEFGTLFFDVCDFGT